MKKKERIILSILMLIIFVIIKFMGGSTLVSFFLAVSLPILIKLSEIENKKRIIAILIGLIILGTDLFLIILLIVPTNSYKINIGDYYKNKGNYAKIFLKDNKSDLYDLKIIIKNDGITVEKIELSKYKGKKIAINEGDKVYFVCSIKNKCNMYKSFMAIYLWDDSILRITPGTNINLKTIDKNINKLTDSKTKIGIEKGNLWFHVIRLIKDSNSMQIEVGKGQSLIIRGTAGLISKKKEKLYAIDYSHYIEIQNNGENRILEQGQGAEINKNGINIDSNEKILKIIGIEHKVLRSMNSLDKKYIDDSIININNYLRKFNKNSFMGRLEDEKLNIFSIGDKKYKRYFNNMTNYKYLIGKGKDFTTELIENSNLAFLAGNIQKNQIKIRYIYYELKKDLKNIDIFKTYIINLLINGEKKLKGIIKNGVLNIDSNLENIMKKADYNIDEVIKNLHY